MNGISTINYKDKTIIYIDYSATEGAKEQIIQILQDAIVEYQEHPKKSVLSLVNFTNFRFDNDILYAFKKSREVCDLYEKKTALFGIKGLLKVAYNFVVQLTQRDSVKLVETEIEGKEWLVND